MDLKKALEIFGIESACFTEIDYNYLKKKYHKLALLYHPDKNKSEESTIKFRELKDAYEFLLQELDLLKENSESELQNDFTYYQSLNIFLQTIFNNTCIITYIIDILSTNSLDISVKMIDKLDKETTINIYSFLEKYKFLLHIPNELVERIKEVVNKKYENVTIYKLNPTLKDLYEHNIFQLKIENDFYIYVPLWHHEMYYDISGNEFIVICEPELSNNLEIDEENNIIITHNINKETFFNLLNKKYLDVTIYNKSLHIPVNELHLRNSQSYIFKNQGISIVNDDIYNIGIKSNVIVKIIILN